MPISKNDTPIALSISGHDPTGGAGVIADAEVFTQFGCHPCTILTCQTVQDSSTVHRLISLSGNNLIEQANILFNDMPIAAIKIGLTGSVECVEAIVNVVLKHPNIPVVFDPILASGDGTALASEKLIRTIADTLLPLVDVLTPNTLEAVKLCSLSTNSSIDSLGKTLLKQGAKNVLITGGHEHGEQIINHLFQANAASQQYSWIRLHGEYHGTGCTLASAIAALIAKGESIPSAVEQAQTYTDQAIRHARKIGKGQAFPSRGHIDTK
ncbi:MAG TPA: hydroxymethylpyrimidine/phosphomethylpyrimidine kinase [Cycloclasticus sp.]|jgi:hydroxymethylpyrimidine/phosphomethylpyrimidine kinase|nr:hydroxymethylpyrimidine/phosphomethylpyrimidine kinase [Cycloclasticus sp.]HIL93374.1 hydroxymethylpyrimidine/phosphomethylpyrimidine kinase [Cycloclasticus sp.]